VTNSLYYWGGNSGNATRYEEMAYGMYKHQSPEALCDMLCVYEDMIQHPTGERQVPPPGICAEYAYYLSMPETAQIFATTAKKSQKSVFARNDYASFFPEYAKQLFEKELTLYPESAVFIKPIITKLTQQ
jgi:hypothetical protein